VDDGVGTANRRFAVAAVDWELLGPVHARVRRESAAQTQSTDESSGSGLECGGAPVADSWIAEKIWVTALKPIVTNSLIFGEIREELGENFRD